jgi:iron(III) transport system substrate-binding protein
VYSTTHPAIQANLAQAFTKKTGITVQSLRLNTAALAQRFLAEQKSGQHICDVLTLGNDIFFDQLAAAGTIDDVSARPTVAPLAEVWRPNKRYVMITASPAGIAYNKKSVTGASIPKGWEDLLRPEFKGQIIFTDPRLNETLVQFVAILQEAYGDDYLRKLGKQDLKLVPVTQQGVEQLAAGEGKLVVPCNPGNLERYQGQDAPVALTPTPTPTFWTQFYSGIVAKAPNKAGAERWFDFVLSPEAQEILCKGVSVSPLADIPGAIPTPPGAKMENPDLAASVAKSKQLFDLLGLPA